MRASLIFVFIFISVLLSAQPYYIAPDGNDDTGDGSDGNEWFSLAYAMNQCSAGDTVYAKTGTYSYDNVQTVDVSGTEGNYIVLTSESGDPDDVIFDFWNYDVSGEAPKSIYGIYSYGDSYLKFEKFSLRRVWKINTDNGRAHGLYFQECDYIDFDWLVIDSIAGRGIMGYRSGTANIANCDFSWCADPQDSDPGNAGVGVIWYQTTDSPNDTLRVTGCRFWQNADQGIETLTGNVVYLDSLWSWDNDLHDEGYTSGTGNGFKPSLGMDRDLPITMTRCISAYNRVGINENTTSGGYKFNFNCYNNLIWETTGVGIIATEYPSGGTSRENKYQNNISFANDSWDLQIQDSVSLHSYNSFDGPYTSPAYGSYFSSPATVNSDDFIDLPSDRDDCTVVLGAARDANGYLPDIGDYFKLASTSDLIDAGTDVGYGDDMGPFQYVEQDPAVNPTVTTTLTSYSSVRAIITGNVTDDGGGTVSARGICFDTSANPTTSDSKVPSGSSTGEFSCTLILASNTTYHVRAYATNETGTSYGQDIEITTYEKSLLFDDDGNVLTDDSGNVLHIN